MRAASRPKTSKKMDKNPANQSIDAISRMKWIGIDEKSFNAIEDRQRVRIKALRDLLEAEELELTHIMAARTSPSTASEHHNGTIFAPVAYSDKMTWKDKIILVIAEAKRPMLAREIAPVLALWEPMLAYSAEKMVSVLLTRMVKDGALVRTSRNGRPTREPSNSWW